MSLQPNNTKLIEALAKQFITDFTTNFTTFSETKHIFKLKFRSNEKNGRLNHTFLLYLLKNSSINLIVLFIVNP
jgi:hypothetical protein